MSTQPVAEPELVFMGMSWRKVMMWIFIVTDGLLFAGFLASYGFARLASESWPPQEEVFHLWFISLMTFVLISSSATMATAENPMLIPSITARTRLTTEAAPLTAHAHGISPGE